MSYKIASSPFTILYLTYKYITNIENNNISYELVHNIEPFIGNCNLQKIYNLYYI